MELSSVEALDTLEEDEEEETEMREGEESFPWLKMGVGTRMGSGEEWMNPFSLGGSAATFHWSHLLGSGTRLPVSWPMKIRTDWESPLTMSCIGIRW